MEEGKSYKMNLPNGIRNKRVHIDYILDNLTDSSVQSKLVVYRYWSRTKKRWFHGVDEKWVLNLWNNKI